MSNVVGEIVIDVTADVGPLMRQMGKAEGAMTGLQGAAGRMGRGLQSAGNMTVTFGRNMAVVAAGVAAVTGAALAFVRRSAAFGDAIGDASRAAGMSTTAFQEYRFAIKEAADMTDEEFASAAARLNKTLGEAREGSLAAVAAFEKIGISQAELADASFNTDRAMAAYVATMEGLTDPTIAAAVSTDLFGRAGAGMGAALSGVPGQVGSLVDQARELGVVLSEDAVNAAGAFDEKINGLSASFESFKLKAANELLPAMTDYVIPAIQDYVLPALEKFAGAVAGAIVLIGKFASGAVTAFNTFRDGAAAAVDYVVGKFEAFIVKLNELLTKVQEIGTAIQQSFTFQAGDGQINNGLTAPGRGPTPGAGWIQGGAGGAGGAIGGQMLGAAIVNGAVLGAMNSLNENRETLASIFAQIPQIARETLGINSPSKVFEEIGGNIGQGMAQGIAASNAMVAAAVQSMGTGAVNATNGMVGDILGGLDTLLAGSQKGGAALAWVNTLIGASQEIKKGTFGFASMARVLAQGAALVKGINGARGGRSAAGAGGGSSAASAAATAAPAQQNVQTLNFTLQNDTFGIGANLVRQIAAQLNEAQRNGSTLIRATVS